MSNNWIPVTERLPEEYGRYIVQYTLPEFGCDSNGKCRQDIGICSYDPVNSLWCELRKVVAWQPLPELWVDPSLPQKGDYGYYDGEKWIKIRSIEMTGNAPVDIEDLGEVTYTTTIYPESGKPMVVKLPVNKSKIVYINEGGSSKCKYSCVDYPCKYCHDDPISGTSHCILLNTYVPDDIDRNGCPHFVFAKTCIDCKHANKTMYETGTLDSIEYRCNLQNDKYMYDDGTSFTDHYDNVPECNIGKFEYKFND